jgi:hypothetical protein
MFGTLIIDIIALVFIWLAFMAAKNVSKAVAGAIEPFEKIGSQIGGLAKSLPKYTPLPIPGGSLAGAQRAATDLAHIPEAAANKRYENSAVGKLLHADLNIPQSEVDKLAQALKNGTGSPQDMDIIKRIMKEYGGRQDAYRSGAPEAFMETLKDDNKRKTFFDTAHMSDSDQSAFEKFRTSHPNGIATDADKKELMGLMNSAFGKPGGATGGDASKASGFTQTEVKDPK